MKFQCISRRLTRVERDHPCEFLAWERVTELVGDALQIGPHNAQVTIGGFEFRVTHDGHHLRKRDSFEEQLRDEGCAEIMELHGRDADASAKVSEHLCLLAVSPIPFVIEHELVIGITSHFKFHQKLS